MLWAMSNVKGLLEYLGSNSGYGYGDGYGFGDSSGRGYGKGYGSGYGKGYDYGDGYGFYTRYFKYKGETCKEKNWLQKKITWIITRLKDFMS